MSDWKSVFQEIDDDYLIGISNKGTVKRAYKDKEEVSCEILPGDAGEELAVKVGGETVHIKIPLGESQCSCPSRSICRHVILGILAAKEAAEIQEPAKAQGTAESDEAQTADSQKNDGMLEKTMQQIAAYPVEKLWKVLGTRRLQEVIVRARSGSKPQFEYTSVVTVQPLAQGMTVKLLFPLEYATCSCHKKEFCAHKAEALLWCKLESGQLCIDELEQGNVRTADYDMEQIHAAATQMKVFLNELFDTGLSRTPQNALDYMERMAIISHNAKLPDFEGSWRALQNVYGRYQKRAASVGIQDVMDQITRLYLKTQRLENAQDCLAVSRLGGEFRAGYTESPDLDLTGIATEHFKSKSGYEGDTVYFFERNTKEWFTYTQAAPVFYENAVERKAYQQETPWGLPVFVKDLAFWHIRLRQAKCDNRGRLSSSKETRGELIADRRKDKGILTAEMLDGWFYEDFARLFAERINMSETGQVSGRPTLAFLKPRSCGQAVFSETDQKLYMTLCDGDRKEVIVEVVYSGDEAEKIRCLEKITNESLPCFFGKIYLRDGRIRMYPIAVFGEKEMVWKKEISEDG